MKSFAASYGVVIAAPEELRGKFGTPPEINENGRDFLENARLKAQGFFNWSGMSSLADDAGLEVAALGGAPGIHTARFAGPDCSSADNRRKLLQVMRGISDRTARFVCVLYLLSSEGPPLAVRAELPGEIGLEERGAGGFGYDRVFAVGGFAGKTLAELKEEKVALKTHRILALEKLFAKLV